MMRGFPLAIAWTITSALSLHAQAPESLRTAARTGGGIAKVFLNEDFSMLPVGDLSRKADVIVSGRVTNILPHLTADESTVVTDITITPARVLKQVVPVASRPQPGVTRPVVVRHVGGTVVEGPLTMSTYTSGFPAEEELVLGEDVVCFLIYNAPAGVFELVDGPFAAFRVRNGEVHALTKRAGDRLGRQEPPQLSAFLADVDRHLRVR